MCPIRKKPPKSLKPQIDPSVKRTTRGDVTDPAAPLRNVNHEKFLVFCCQQPQAEAFVEVYPRSKSWTQRTIDSRASELVRKYAGRMEYLIAQFAKTMMITPDRVLSRYAQLAFTDLPGIVKWKGRQDRGGRKKYDMELVDFDQLTPAQRAVIRKIKITAAGTVEIEVHDQVRALDALAKHLGLFREEGSSLGTMNVQINFGDGRTLEIGSRDNALDVTRSREDTDDEL
jgi:hypothetical protein